MRKYGQFYICYGILCTSIFISGCQTLDKYVSLKQQCSIIQNTVSTGFSFALMKYKPKELQKHREKFCEIIEKKILPLLEKKRISFDEKDWDILFSYLDGKLSLQEELAIKAGINQISSFIGVPYRERRTKEEKITFSQRLVHYLKCMFKGILDLLKSLKKDNKKKGIFYPIHHKC
ncbi:MAG: hypothetical protein D6813_13885 [Calditrichaeota bacterium]|nr:MAG: hypothetical protein D6813_13885 [Calditrichota bacterium]